MFNFGEYRTSICIGNEVSIFPRSGHFAFFGTSLLYEFHTLVLVVSELQFVPYIIRSTKQTALQHLIGWRSAGSLC